MVFRSKRMLLLSIVALLLGLSILDLSIRKEEIFETFGRQFVNERKTDAHYQERQSAVSTARSRMEWKKDGVNEVALTSGRGKVTVKRSADSVIRLEAAVTASGEGQEAADRKRDAVQLRKELQEGRLLLGAEMNGKPVRDDAVAVDYELHLPDGLKLRLENREGDALIQGLQGEVEAVSYRGQLDIIGVAGRLTVEVSNGSSLYLSDIAGDTELVNRSGRTRLEHIRGRLNLNSRFGENRAEGITGPVAGVVEHGYLHVQDVQGAVEIESRISTLQVARILGDIRITANSGDTDVLLPETGGYALDAEVNGGRIHHHLPFSAESEDGGYRSRLKGTIGDGPWQAHIRSENGDLHIHSK